MIPLNNTARIKAYLGNGALGFSAAALIIYLVIIGGNQDAVSFMYFQDTSFNFHVYCPIDTPTAAGYYQNYFGYTYNPANTSNLYVVYVQSRNVTTSVTDATTNATTNSTDLGLFYCGLARQWSGNCSNAKLVCTSPGPMFYLPVDQQVTIVWVNNITSKDVSWPQEGCYSSDSHDMDCLIDAKIINPYQPQSQGCTFNQPTNYSFSTRKVRVNSSQVPLSPHIHGLETRPAFDGNPLSWFNNVGDKGVGYFSLNDSLYFSQFSNAQYFAEFQTNNQKLPMKIIKAANKQSPGSLFYHDHAMKSTKFNVAHGLAGMYILYNKTAQQNLPKGTEEKYILFSHANDGDLRTLTQSTTYSTTAKSSSASMHSGVSHSSTSEQIPILHKDKVYTLNSGNDTYSRNMTYRFRILNSHYDNVYYNVSFAAYYNTIQLPNGTKVIQQLDPFASNFPLTDYLTKINFTVIGTDSTMFNNPVPNVSQFDAGAAERMDLLIKFGPENGIPSNVNNFYLICYDGNAGDYVIKVKFSLNQLKTQNKYKDPVATQPLPLPFYNLSAIPKSQIAVNRMRGLFSRPSDTRFVINGHYMFNMGQTENPKIGTTQDWYIINNLFEPHPIHLHLVNFQVMQTFDLKISPEGCTLYELDYFRFSNYSKFKGLNNAELCYSLGNMTLDETAVMYNYLQNYSLQTDIKPASIGQVSGLNVLEQIITASDRSNYAQFTDCSLNSIYKYVCSQSTSTIKSWYKRWKETALVRQYTVMVLRVRWASTSYDENVKPYPYFSAASEEQLMEFPGFVYHCHILPHEDNEMMRPFMLKPSDKYLQSKNSSSNSLVSSYLTPQQVQTLNLNSITLSPIIASSGSSDTNWLSKAQQINFMLRCPV